MSALWAHGITNVLIEIDNKEVPGLDGSSIEFYDKIKTSGIEEQDALAEVLRIHTPIGVQANGCSIYAVPSEDFKISYLLDYDHSVLSSQFFEIGVIPENYSQEIAPARTFCLESEAKKLQDAGLGKGANYQNTLVVGEQGVIDNTLRFDNEFARHKILDLIGDTYVLGKPIVGHIFAMKSGHYLNLQLLRQVVHQAQQFPFDTQAVRKMEVGQKEFFLDDIMKVLPHRYPFLLVDHVTVLEEGKKAVGIKNVTGNEDFFQGHFPTRPVMPGVLMVEAMAQTAGCCCLDESGPSW